MVAGRRRAMVGASFGEPLCVTNTAPAGRYPFEGSLRVANLTKWRFLKTAYATALP